MKNRCGNPVLREMIAENYWTLIKESNFSPQVNEVFYALARNNFIYSRNSIRLAELLIEVYVLKILKDFSKKSHFLERIPVEYIELICSLESKLIFMSICSIRIRSRK